MHDPQTQAFVIPYGWKTQTFKNGTKWRYWKPLITIWHVDPERDGSDDSCGWSRPRLNKQQREICKSLADDEARDPWFMALDAKTNPNSQECEILLRGAFLLISRCLENRGYLRPWYPFAKPVTVTEATKWASLLTHNSIDSFRSSLCFKSGYHSNWYVEGVPNTVEQDVWHRQYNAERFFIIICAYILRERRLWFKHPKWHVIHWKRVRDYNKTDPNYKEDMDWRLKHPYKYWGLPIPVVGWMVQVHLVQTFKRWAFSRCCVCGRRFSWGYAPLSHSWNGTGPRWFRSEEYVQHSDCLNPTNDKPCAVGGVGGSDAA